MNAERVSLRLQRATQAGRCRECAAAIAVDDPIGIRSGWAVCARCAGRWGTCAICTCEAGGAWRPLDGRRLFICDRCEDEHPRAGGYSFDGDRHESEGAAHLGGKRGGGHGGGRHPMVARRRG